MDIDRSKRILDILARRQFTEQQLIILERFLDHCAESDVETLLDGEFSHGHTIPSLDPFSLVRNLPVLGAHLKLRTRRVGSSQIALRAKNGEFQADEDDEIVDGKADTRPHVTNIQQSLGMKRKRETTIAASRTPTRNRRSPSPPGLFLPSELAVPVACISNADLHGKEASDDDHDAMTVVAETIDTDNGNDLTDNEGPMLGDAKCAWPDCEIQCPHEEDTPYRKVVSDCFGRNVSALRGDVPWIFICRRRYQRQNYAGLQSLNELRAKMLVKQLELWQVWGGFQEFEVHSPVDIRGERTLQELLDFARGLESRVMAGIESFPKIRAFPKPGAFDSVKRDEAALPTLAVWNNSGTSVMKPYMAMSTFSLSEASLLQSNPIDIPNGRSLSDLMGSNLHSSNSGPFLHTNYT